MKRISSVDEQRIILEAEINKKYPFITNMSSVSIVEAIKKNKAILYDLEKRKKNLEDLNSALDAALLFRPTDKRIHYFDSERKYDIDPEEKKQ